MTFDHLDRHRLSYCEHARHALRLSAKSFFAGVALLVHAIYPDWCTETGTNTLHSAIREHRQFELDHRLERRVFSVMSDVKKYLKRH